MFSYIKMTVWVYVPFEAQKKNSLLMLQSHHFDKIRMSAHIVLIAVIIRCAGIAEDEDRLHTVKLLD